jgi:Zn-dependent peptidase ImmA (M78 family)
MMTKLQRGLAQAATIRAARLRAKHKISLQDPACPYRLAEAQNMDVRFIDIPSMEGIYRAGDAPAIVVSSQRPFGRQAFTCAHELGHHEFGHGSQYDEFVEHRRESRPFEPNEYQADCFAGALLMPITAIGSGFGRRGWNAVTATPEQLYRVSMWLGVGYGTLARQLSILNIRSIEDTDLLRKHQPKDIRRRLLGDDCLGLCVVDEHWTGRPADTFVDDFILCPPNTQATSRTVTCCERAENRTVFHCDAPGQSELLHPKGWSAKVRVMRRGFVGRSVFRFEPEESE